MLPLAVHYEHPDWFRPLFAELDRRGISYQRLAAGAAAYDLGAREAPYSLFFNRASPSAFLRGNGHSILSTLSLLHHVERLGVPVVNGSNAYALELSKARQLTLLEALGVRYPRSWAVNHGRLAPEVARHLRFPVVVKANIGGSGAGIVRYDTPAELARAAEAGTLPVGLDGTSLVQELAPLRGGHIVRVEVLGGEVLYGIRVFPEAGSFDLCPADACQTPDGKTLTRSACAVDAPKRGLRVEAFDPPPAMRDAAVRIARAAHLDVGGIEYLVDDRDGEAYVYDINALSNFVADAVNVVGVDPFARLVDYLVARAERRVGGL